MDYLAIKCIMSMRTPKAISGSVQKMGFVDGIVKTSWPKLSKTAYLIMKSSLSANTAKVESGFLPLVMNSAIYKMILFLIGKMIKG